MDTPVAEHAEVQVTHRVTPETPPALVSMPPGDYVCLVRLHVGADGVPTGVEPLDCAEPLLASTLDATLQWRFEPLIRTDGPVPFDFDVRVVYRRTEPGLYPEVGWVLGMTPFSEGAAPFAASGDHVALRLGVGTERLGGGVLVGVRGRGALLGLESRLRFATKVSPYGAAQLALVTGSPEGTPYLHDALLVGVNARVETVSLWIGAGVALRVWAEAEPRWGVQLDAGLAWVAR